MAKYEWIKIAQVEKLNKYEENQIGEEIHRNDND